MPNNRLDFESIDQVEVFKENGDVIGTVKVSGVRSIEAAIEKCPSAAAGSERSRSLCIQGVKPV